MNFEQIKELIELVAEHRLASVELERSGLRLRIEGVADLDGFAGAGSGAVAAYVPESTAAPPEKGPGSPAPPAAKPAAAESPSAETSGDELPEGTHVLNSPIVGTFYAAPNPDAPPFVKVGDRVEPGDVLCIVEAMKLMNEIEADVSGSVVKIYPKNSQAVEFGEPLFAIKPD